MKRTATPPVLVTSILLIFVVLGSVLFLLQMHPLSFRASLPPDTSSRPPFIVATNPYSVQSVAVGTPYRILLASLKSGYATLLPDRTLDTLPISSTTLPAGMTIDPVTIDVPIATATQRVRVRELSWQPSASDIGDHTVTLTSTVTLSGTTYMADPLSITFRVFNPSLSRTNEQILAEVVSRHFTTASSVSELLQTITFDDALQNMTSDELLHALIAQGMITRYPSYEALIAALPSQAIDLTNLKPYGILQALATPAKGGTILRQKDAQKPWMIVQDAYDDLHAAFDADPFALLHHYDPHHLLTTLDDRIALPSGSSELLPVYSSTKETSTPAIAPDVRSMAFLTGRRYDGVQKESESQYRDRFQQLAVSIKAKTDLMPEGHRVIKLQGIERLSGSLLLDGVFPPFRSSTGALIESQGFFSSNYDCSGGINPTTCPDGPPSPTGCIDGSIDYKKNHCLYSLWFDNTDPEEAWSQTVRSRLNEFFRVYKSIGGKVDFIVTDMETDWLSLYFTRRIWFLHHEDRLQQDPRWPSLLQDLQDAGITDFHDIQNWFAHSDWRGLLWDSVMAHRLATTYNQTMMYSIQFDGEQGGAPLFPHIQFTDYEFFYRSNLVPVDDYTNFPKNIASVGDIVGTQPSLEAYARRTLFGMPSGLPTDTPTEPVGFFENLLYDIKRSRTFPTSSTLPGMIWIAHPYYTRYSIPSVSSVADPLFVNAALDDIDAWYMERMFHHGLTGIDGFINWTASTLDTAIKDAHDGSLDEYDRGFTVMEQGIHELNAKIGFSDRHPLVMRSLDFQDGYALSGMEVHGKRIYRFTPDPDVPSEVRTVGDGIELYSNGVRIASIPHSVSQQSYKGYWITQYEGRDMLTATPDEILNALQ